MRVQVHVACTLLCKRCYCSRFAICKTRLANTMPASITIAMKISLGVMTARG